MKNLFNLTLSAVIALTLITSCKKETATSDPKAEKEITSAQMKNSSNPYDKEGELHNKFLDYFITKADLKKDINRDKIFVIYEGFHNENKMVFGDVQIREFGIFMDSFSQLNIGGPYKNLNLCKQYPALCNVTGTGPYNPLEMLIPTDATTSTDRTLAYIKAIAEEEAKVLRNDKLEDEVKKDLLHYYTVARHSSAYWHNVAKIQKSKSGWHDSFTQGEVAALCHVCDVVGADAAGGAIGGGIGAGVASGAAVVEKLINWFW